MTNHNLIPIQASQPKSANQLAILYIGHDKNTSGHRVRALERLGHDVTIVNPSALLPEKLILTYWNHHSGCLFLDAHLHKRILTHIPPKSFDLVFVGATDLVPPDTVRELRRRFPRVIAYNIDDPYGQRDGAKWRLFLKSIGLYDLVVVVRACNVAEALSKGAREVMRVSMAADEVAHRPRKLSEGDISKWTSAVAFIGTWMPERGPFLGRLADLGVPLAIYGDRWNRAKEWPLLKHFWRGPTIGADHEYSLAVQCASVCLGLLSKGNRDLSTTRSFEIPHLGGVLCAERTTEHESLYTEDREAVFWDSPEECAAKCTLLLANSNWRQILAENGRRRCLLNKTTNEAVLAAILDKVTCYVNTLSQAHNG